MRRGVAALLVCAAALAGCGDGSDGTADAPRDVSPRQAAAEARATKAGLDRALERYREGDRGAAADAVAATRGEHFAAVEPALAKVDAVLARRLHAALGTELPKLIDDGVTVSVLARRLVAVERDLDTAAGRLGTP